MAMLQLLCGLDLGGAVNLWPDTVYGEVRAADIFEL
jgi:hypothetical protein